MWRKELCIVLYLCCVLWGQSSEAESNCDRKEKSSLNLEIAENLIKKTLLIIPDCPETVTNKSQCGAKAKMTANLDLAKKLITEARLKYPTCIDEEQRNITEPVVLVTTETTDEEQRNTTEPVVLLTTETTEPTTEQPSLYPNPKDCSEVLQNGNRANGVYTIWLGNSQRKNRSLDVFCDMSHDDGGWTVIQRRGNFTPQEDFYRDWKDYKEGFGRITKDFWIGNDNLFGLTSQANYSVKFDLEDVNGNKNSALYGTFWIEDEPSKYRLHINSYSGSAGDSMKDSDNMYFSTKDRHNDNYIGHCARDLRQGGWWYRDCGYCNPNGLYRPGVDGISSMYWYHWQRYDGMAATEIKIKRKFE